MATSTNGSGQGFVPGAERRWAQLPHLFFQTAFAFSECKACHWQKGRTRGESQTPLKKRRVIRKQRRRKSQQGWRSESECKISTAPRGVAVRGNANLKRCAPEGYTDTDSQMPPPPQKAVLNALINWALLSQNLTRVQQFLYWTGFCKSICQQMQGLCRATVQRTV